eukprot:TRINITY_DN67598_c0_g1_i1.p1 TRINITY_DN67598_c0_g1~~TRINITY_DN67598_c0_g1_i1.p1  ORF type:complete len:1047 (+),score=168.97 TRINITY_DN67598_c0_g1_i1:179-3319(+)
MPSASRSSASSRVFSAEDEDRALAAQTSDLPQFGAAVRGSQSSKDDGSERREGYGFTSRLTKANASDSNGGVGGGNSAGDTRALGDRGKVSTKILGGGVETSSEDELGMARSHPSSPSRARGTAAGSLLASRGCTAGSPSEVLAFSSAGVNAAVRDKIVGESDQLAEGAKLVGRDVPAKVGMRVCVVDDRVARYVAPTGSIIELRCGGERVRVEHDGHDKAQRYYSTGKGGEYQLLVDPSGMFESTELGDEQGIDRNSDLSLDFRSVSTAGSNLTREKPSGSLDRSTVADLVRNCDSDLLHDAASVRTSSSSTSRSRVDMPGVGKLPSAASTHAAASAGSPSSNGQSSTFGRASAEQSVSAGNTSARSSKARSSSKQDDQPEQQSVSSAVSSNVDTSTALLRKGVSVDAAEARTIDSGKNSRSSSHRSISTPCASELSSAAASDVGAEKTLLASDEQLPSRRRLNEFRKARGSVLSTVASKAEGGKRSSLVKSGQLSRPSTRQTRSTSLPGSSATDATALAVDGDLSKQSPASSASEIRRASSQKRVQSSRHETATAPMSPQQSSEQAWSSTPSITVTAPSTETARSGDFKSRKMQSDVPIQATSTSEASSAGGCSSSRVEVLELGLAALASRSRELENRLTNQLADARLQLEASERRVMDRMVEEVEQCVQKLASSTLAQLLLKSGAVSCGGGGTNKLATDGNDLLGSKRSTGVSAMNFEPEQEYESGDAGSQRSVDSVSPSEERGSFGHAVAGRCLPSVPSPGPKAAATSAGAALKVPLSAHIGDCQQRLLDIESISRHASASLNPRGHLGGTSGARPDTAFLAAFGNGDAGIRGARFGSDTAGSAAVGLDGLDAEMAKLADLRRSTSTLLGVVASDEASSVLPTESALHRWGGARGIGGGGVPRGLCMSVPSATLPSRHVGDQLQEPQQQKDQQQHQQNFRQHHESTVSRAAPALQSHRSTLADEVDGSPRTGKHSVVSSLPSAQPISRQMDGVVGGGGGGDGRFSGAAAHDRGAALPNAKMERHSAIERVVVAEPGPGGFQF